MRIDTIYDHFRPLALFCLCSTKELNDYEFDRVIEKCRMARDHGYIIDHVKGRKRGESEFKFNISNLQLLPWIINSEKGSKNTDLRSELEKTKLSKIRGLW